jgi:translation initiation factor IF-1
MVKNTFGGKKAKAFSRKDSQSFSHSSDLRLPDNELECFAKVTKLFGNSMCQVSLLHNNLSLIAHIRAKMSGKNKRLFTIHNNDFILVGLRHWESSPKHCDIIHIYSHHDISLLSSLPSFSHLFSSYSSHDLDLDLDLHFHSSNPSNTHSNPSDNLSSNTISISSELISNDKLLDLIIDDI